MFPLSFVLFSLFYLTGSLVFFIPSCVLSFLTHPHSLGGATFCLAGSALVSSLSPRRDIEELECEPQFLLFLISLFRGHDFFFSPIRRPVSHLRKRWRSESWVLASRSSFFTLYFRPNLYGLFGRTSGTVPGYKYSPANKAAGIVWGEDTLFECM